MTARTTVHGLQVATELHQFIERQVLPATGVASDVFWKGFDAIVSEFAPKNLALLAERDRLQAEMDTWHKAHPGPDRRHAGLPRLPRIDRLPAAAAEGRAGHHRQRRRRTRPAGRPATGGADPQRALCAQRRERALGLAVRRALRHRRHPRDRRRREGQGLQPGARRQGDRVRAPCARPGRAARRTARTRTRPATRSRTASWWSRCRAAAPASRTRRSSSATRAMRRRRSRCCSSTTASTSTSRSTAATAIGKTDAAGVSDVVLEAALSTILDLRRLGGGGRCRRQGAGLLATGSAS